MNDIDDRPEVKALLANIKAGMPALEKLLSECNDHWVYEDLIYRLYHQSFKVWFLVGTIEETVKALQSLLPERPLNKWFLKIVEDGTKEKVFKMEFNQAWLEKARPIVEAFFHARFFLEMAVKYGKELQDPPNLLPSGWAALLYLYDLR